MGKGKKRICTQQQSRTNDICAYYREKGHWKRDCPNLSSDQGMFVVEVNMVTNSASWVLDTGCGAHICNDLQVLQRSRKLSKDEVVLKLGDDKGVRAEAVGIINLVVSDRVRLELKDCYFVPSMIKNIISIPLLDNKSEAFVRFKEFRLEVENQTGHKIKTLQSDRGGEYLSGEFIDYLKENGYALEKAARLLNIAPSKTVAQTPYQIWHGKPASYKYLRVWGSLAYVKRLVGDKLDLRSSLCRFIGYPKETAGYYFYDPSEQKVFISRNAVFLERGFPTDTRRDELLVEESSEAPQSNAGTSSAPNVSTDNVSILRRSARVPQALKRMLDIPYASAVGSIQYAAQCTRPDIAYALSVTSRYQACAGEAHWTAVKTILKYLRRTKDVFLVYGGGQLILEGFSDASFLSDDDDAKSQSGLVFKLKGGVVTWKSSKQDTTADSTTEAEYIAGSEAAKEAVWMKNYI
ncbi:UNVERIFIED_CONTAM: Retrovirus-related Pol polyprotein from transposon TNT 1-94 [Sesamum calycinum]|uniref:Retrovirus-related Pol polyprotein from transposon TNT 1-94 n=1 Tax=Sesamum calycinum TaxID=2727403 RepID=A0AAW2KQ71_9LAMI